MLLELIKNSYSDFFCGSFHHLPSVDEIIDRVSCIELVINAFLDFIELYLLFFPLESIDLVIDLQLEGLHVLLFHYDCTTRISQSFKAHLQDYTIKMG